MAAHDYWTPPPLWAVSILNSFSSMVIKTSLSHQACPTRMKSTDESRGASVQCGMLGFLYLRFLHIFASTQRPHGM